MLTNLPSIEKASRWIILTVETTTGRAIYPMAELVILDDCGV